MANVYSLEVNSSCVSGAAGGRGGLGRAPVGVHRQLATRQAVQGLGQKPPDTGQMCREQTAPPCTTRDLISAPGLVSNPISC